MFFVFFSVVCTKVSVAVFAAKFSDFFRIADHAYFHFSFIFCVVLSVVMAALAGLFVIIEMK